MNTRISELAEQNGFIHNWQPPGEQYEKLQTLEKFALLIVYDFLSELTNDDSLGEARIATIRRLAEKWGVAK
jgi:hypothetical protein